VGDRFAFISEALKKQTMMGRYRSLSELGTSDGVYVTKGTDRFINLSSNDYLGLSQHPDMISESNKWTLKYGTGSGSSRLVTGSREYHSLLEHRLGSWLNRESVLSFNSGYQLNSTLLPSLSDKETVLYFDRLNHNSLVQGALGSKATLKRYRHLDYDHLTELLDADAHISRKIIVTESLFSMDGDVADLLKLSQIAEAYNAILIVDDAHAVGVMGEQGKGLTYGYDRIDIVLGTFGKAIGSFGAFVATSSVIHDYLINFCGGFIYTTALPPGVIGATYVGVGLVKDMGIQRSYLQQMGDWFRAELQAVGLSTLGSTTHIIPILIGDERDTLRIAERLRNNGYWVSAIRPPTIQPGTSRIRITLNTMLRQEHLSECVEIIQKGVSSET
jgi:8-amino-7-oxononanoate synthase